MILKFDKFNESLDVDIRQGDKVVCHGSLERFSDEGKYYIDIEGKTGTVVKTGLFNGILFDNYFCSFFNTLDHRIKMKRGLYVKLDNVEKIEKNPENKSVINISEKMKKILEYIEYDGYFYGDIDYVNISDNPESITYISRDRIDRLNYDDDQWNNKYRQEMRVGRFLKIINPYTDDNSLARKINVYKSTYNSLILNKYTFKIVNGEDIRYWYDERHYCEGVGELNKSCMRSNLDRLDLYVENPDKINLLIMLNEDNQLMGRSLIWNVDEPKVTYMDRIYTVYQEDKITFENYANDQGWTIYNNLHGPAHVFIKRNYGGAEENPYMDTFFVFCSKGPKGNNYLANTRNICDKENYELYDEP